MLTRTAKYALRAMGYLATHADGGPVLSRVISERTDIPPNFLSKIMHRLVQASLLKSARGPSGGFTLAKHPDDISLLHVVALFMNPDDFTECVLGCSECDGTCSLHDEQEPITRAFIGMLEGRNITSVTWR